MIKTRSIALTVFDILARNSFAEISPFEYIGAPPGFKNGFYKVVPYFDYPGVKPEGKKVPNPFPDGPDYLITPGWNDTYFGDGPHAGDNFPNTAYVYVYDISNHDMLGDITVIQYLYFYPYNHWWNRHEGDWQRIHVIVNTRHLHDNIDDIEVLGVEYLLHGAHLPYYDDYVMTFEIPPGVGGGGTTITESMPDLTTSLVFNPRENIKLSQGTHPIVYVGALLDDTAADPLADEEPVLAALTAASVRGLTATGAGAGQRLRRVLKDPATGVRTAPLCFASRGFSLPAATRIAGPDRRGLERLCRYVARPGPGGGASAHSRCRPSFLRAQNAVVGWDPPSPALSDGTAGEAGGSGSPAPVSSPALPRGPGAPGPGPRAHRAGPAGCRAVGGGGRLGERCVLRPSAAVGDPAGAGVFLRPQRMRGLWRSPENHRRPDRSGFDPDLSGGGRAAGDALAEGPA